MSSYEFDFQHHGTLYLLSTIFCFSDRLVRLWRVTGTLEEQLNDLDRSVDV